jgi:hypothetical protein
MPRQAFAKAFSLVAKRYPCFACALFLICTSCQALEVSADPPAGKLRSSRALLQAHHIELDKIARISRFRSGVGHDYSDSHEHCRSMKHYFQPRADLDWGDLRIFAPVDAVVESIQAEQYLGQQMTLRPRADGRVRIKLFHVEPIVTAGQAVRAGQVVGTHAGAGTYSDIAILREEDPGGLRLVSQFKMLSPNLLQDYRRRGVNVGDFIISREARDRHPLDCGPDGRFQHAHHHIPDWVKLNPVKPGSAVPPALRNQATTEGSR